LEVGPAGLRPGVPGGGGGLLPGMGGGRWILVRTSLGGREDLGGPPASGPGGRTVDWSTLRIRATADFQFGRGAADALLTGTVSYVVSKNTGKIRNVHVNGEHVLSLRAEDGLFTLKAAGARRLSQAFPAPKLRIVVEEDAVPFHREGK